MNMPGGGVWELGPGQVCSDAATLDPASGLLPRRLRPLPLSPAPLRRRPHRLASRARAAPRPATC